MKLNRYPNAAVVAPLANLPPPSSAAVPPSTTRITNPSYCLGRELPAHSENPAPNAPDPQFPPEADALMHPAPACAATRAACPYASPISHAPKKSAQTNAPYPAARISPPEAMLPAVAPVNAAPPYSIVFSVPTLMACVAATFHAIFESMGPRFQATTTATTGLTTLSLELDHFIPKILKFPVGSVNPIGL